MIATHKWVEITQTFLQRRVIYIYIVAIVSHTQECRVGRLVPNSLPTGEKVEVRPWTGLTNGVYYVGTQKVELERAEEKSAVDGSDLVSRFIYSSS